MEWQLVPKEPTREIEQAAADYMGVCVKAHGLWVAMLSAAPEPPQQMTWRPIETAPRDALLLLWHPKYGAATGHFLAVDIWGVYVPDTPMLFQPRLNPTPTHWTPLLAPPMEPT